MTKMIDNMNSNRKNKIFNAANNFLSDTTDEANKQMGSELMKFKKSNLPSKICLQCNRPFNWRKKWKIVWENVLYCSKKCRNLSKRNN